MNKKLKIVEDAPGGYYAPGMGTYKPKRMKEGRYKTNVKPPYWECKGCKHRAPDYDFEHGALWWKKDCCPKCGSNWIDKNPPRPKTLPPPAPQMTQQRLRDKRVLKFIYERMQNFHLENPNYDYMIHFKEIIDKR